MAYNAYPVNEFLNLLNTKLITAFEIIQSMLLQKLKNEFIFRYVYNGRTKPKTIHYIRALAGENFMDSWEWRKINGMLQRKMGEVRGVLYSNWQKMDYDSSAAVHSFANKEKGHEQWGDWLSHANTFDYEGGSVGESSREYLADILNVSGYAGSRKGIHLDRPYFDEFIMELQNGELEKIFREVLKAVGLDVIT